MLTRNELAMLAEDLREYPAGTNPYYWGYGPLETSSAITVLHTLATDPDCLPYG